METTRKITLPSGATCRVRRMTLRDSLTLGIIADPLSDPKKGATEKESALSQERAVKIQEIVLCDCVGKITNKDGTSFKVVRKQFDDCSDEEANCDLVATTEDGAFIVKEVLELSGFSDAAREAAKPFPEEQASNGDGALPGGAVSQVAV